MAEAAADINTFLDAQEGATLDAQEGATPDTPDAPVPDTPDAAADTTPGPDPWEAGADTFERPYVEGLRRENQRYRQRAKAFEDAYDGFSDEDRAFLLDLTREIKASPQTAAQRMSQVATLLGGNQQQAQAAADAGAFDPNTPLTATDVARILDDRLNARDSRYQAAEATRAQEEAVQSVYGEAEKLGYEQNTPELIQLLWTAANETDNDLAKAHSMLSGRRQKIIDDYVAQKATASDNTPNTSTPGGSAPSGETQITNLKDAKAATIEFLKNQR